MVLQQQLHTVDSVQDLLRTPAYNRRRFVLIDGELFEMSPSNRLHGRLAIRIGVALDSFVEAYRLGEVHVEVGYYLPDDRSTLLCPDVSYVSQARISQQPEEAFVALMPDLAIEIVSPSNTMKQIHRKAQIYLDNGSSLVWIVRPAAKGVDVCRSSTGPRLDITFIGQDSKLSGEDVLPGFELDMTRLFPPSAAS